MNFSLVLRVMVSKRTLLVCCSCISYSFDNRGRSLECESRGESHESENWKWVFRSIQMEFFDTKWLVMSCSIPTPTITLGHGIPESDDPGRKWGAGTGTQVGTGNRDAGGTQNFFQI